MSSQVESVKWGWGLPYRARVAGVGLARLFLEQPSSPWLPVLLYGPVAVAGVAWSCVRQHAPLWAFLVLPPAGFLVWTLLEYVMHSGAFHGPARSPTLQALQASHLAHHDRPKDPHLIVARLSTTLPLALIFFGL